MLTLVPAPIAPIFYSSTPATRPAFAQAGGSWRCSSRDAATALVVSLAGSDAYADYRPMVGGHTLAIWVGIRRNDRATHAAQLEALAVELKSGGLRVRRCKSDGVLDHLLLIDSMKKAEA